MFNHQIFNGSSASRFSVANEKKEKGLYTIKTHELVFSSSIRVPVINWGENMFYIEESF